MEKTIAEKRIQTGFGMIGERIGQAGANQLRKAVKRAQEAGGVGIWIRRQPEQAFAVALFIAAGLYTAWTLRKDA